MMSKQEAIEILQTDNCYECSHGAYSMTDCNNGQCPIRVATRIAIEALKESITREDDGK